jgi:tetratricopeptide (TPR) repeat protein
MQCLSQAKPEASSKRTDPSRVTYRPIDPLNAQAFDDFYNLNYDRSVASFEKVLQRHPDDPFAVNHLLTAVLFRELHRMGVLDPAELAGDNFIAAKHLPPDPAVKERVQSLVNRAQALEEKKLNQDPTNVDALYARGVTRGQFAMYTASVERAWFSALRNAVGARHDHEKVLELSPGYTDARLIVGADSFILGSLSWGMKLAASMVGLSGNKAKGIEDIEAAANGGGEASVDARFVLVLFLRREGRNAEALNVVEGIVPQYPHNLLMALEEGNLSRAVGQNERAAAVYRRVWQQGKQGWFPGMHYEAAAFSLGDLLRSEKDYAGAAAAYESVGRSPQTDPAVLQNANLAAGEMYDLLLKRDLAMSKYEAVLASNQNSSTADLARKHMKAAYRE